MKNALLGLCVAVILAALGLSLKIGPPPASAVISGMTSGDSALAAGGSFKIYPFFTPGGAHIHAPQFVSIDNGFASAQSGYITTSTSSIRVNVYGADCDTSGFTVPALATQTALPTCDSIRVVNTGGTATTVTWGLFR